jgi:hypothetical protein
VRGSSWAAAGQQLGSSRTSTIQRQNRNRAATGQQREGKEGSGGRRKRIGAGQLFDSRSSCVSAGKQQCSGRAATGLQQDSIWTAEAISNAVAGQEQNIIGTEERQQQGSGRVTTG